MSTVIKLKIQVDELDNVLQQFNQIKVYRSTAGINGSYLEITTASTRIPMVQGKSLYEYDDNAGDIIYYYKTSYFKSDTGLESNLSDPRLGDDPSTANIMTVPDLKALYLFGLDLTNDQGVPFPDIIFEWGIRQGIAWIERNLDVRIKPTVFTDERYDYIRADYCNWTIIKLRESPVISVESVKVKWPSSDTVIDFPHDWIQLRKDAGQINIVPTSGALSQVLLTAGGSFLPLVASGRDMVPNILAVDYTAGFEEGKVPIELRDLIGKTAALGTLHIAGDLIGGAGIASKSVSIDGLSQSVSTTSSPSFAGYGARVRNYLAEIKAQIPLLRRYYKGIRLAAL